MEIVRRWIIRTYLKFRLFKSNKSNPQKPVEYPVEMHKNVEDD